MKDNSLDTRLLCNLLLFLLFFIAQCQLERCLDSRIPWSTLYLSNAEVQMNYGRIPTWQNSKVHFFAMSFMVPDRQKYSVDDDLGGEIEIEKLPHLEIEIKRKDLLSVFEHFHKVNSDWSNRLILDAPKTKK